MMQRDLNEDMIYSCRWNGIMLDIGANHGMYTKEMARRSSKVYAFEPDPGNISILAEATKKCNNVEIVPMALSNVCGEAELLLHSWNPGGHSIQPSMKTQQWGHTLDTVKVKTTTLDAWCKENNVEGIVGVKIDVEAHEQEVIEGAKETLKRDHPLIALETHFGCDLKKVLKALKDCGYGYNIGELLADQQYFLK